MAIAPHHYPWKSIFHQLSAVVLMVIEKLYTKKTNNPPVIGKHATKPEKIFMENPKRTSNLLKIHIFCVLWNTCSCFHRFSWPLRAHRGYTKITTTNNHFIFWDDDDEGHGAFLRRIVQKGTTTAKSVHKA